MTNSFVCIDDISGAPLEPTTTFPYKSEYCSDLDGSYE